MRHLPAVIFASALSLVACGSSRERSGFETSRQATDPAGEHGSLGDGEVGGSSSTNPSCAANVNTATRAEVDVILVIDTSGSMDAETAQVNENLNQFARSIGNSGLDYNVIVVAQKPSYIFGFPTGGVCVPEPLAGKKCADGPKFHHLDTMVDSFNSLKVLLSSYSSYSKWLRPSAYKIFIEVTDDNADLAFDSFDQQLLAKDPAQFGTATSRRYIFNSICGWKRGTPILSAEKCGSDQDVVNIGEQYQRLSQLTGGTIESVCEHSYTGVFDNIGKGLVMRLGCEFAFPKSDSGAPSDPSEVAVTYTPGTGASKHLTQVTDKSKCDANPDAWYYDTPTAPTKIIFCPSTCSGPGADTGGKLEVAVGCKVAPPK
jgi:hypothetical protein